MALRDLFEGNDWRQKAEGVENSEVRDALVKVVETVVNDSEPEWDYRRGDHATVTRVIEGSIGGERNPSDSQGPFKELVDGRVPGWTAYMDDFGADLDEGIVQRLNPLFEKNQSVTTEDGKIIHMKGDFVSDLPYQNPRRDGEPAEFDVGALVHEAAFLQNSGSPQVFDKTPEKKTAYVLVDGSGSGATLVSDDKTSFDVRKESAGQLCHELEAAGYNVSLVVYTSDSDTTFFKYVGDAKDLDFVSPDLANRDGAAIRRATRKLVSEEGASKALFVLGDGQPSVGPDYCGQYALQDTAHALQEAAGKGVSVSYVAVGKPGELQTQAYAKTNSVTSVESPGDLPEVLGALVSALHKPVDGGNKE